MELISLVVIALVVTAVVLLAVARRNGAIGGGRVISEYELKDK